MLRACLKVFVSLQGLACNLTLALWGFVTPWPPTKVLATRVSLHPPSILPFPGAIQTLSAGRWFSSRGFWVPSRRALFCMRFALQFSLDRAHASASPRKRPRHAPEETPPLSARCGCSRLLHCGGQPPVRACKLVLRFQLRLLPALSGLVPWQARLVPVRCASS